MIKPPHLRAPTETRLAQTKKAKPTARSKAKARSSVSKDTKECRAQSARDGSKLAKLIALLRREEGATIDQMAQATRWQTHSVRGAISGALKKKMGLKITSTKVDGTRTYRIAG